MMQRSKKWGIGAALGLLVMVAAARADTAGATAAFKKAQQFQAAKQWGAAVKEYQAALAADSKYVWAYKGLGTTYYQAGDKKGALAYYDKYLAANPSDVQTKAFADRLRAETGGGAVAASGAAPPAEKPVNTKPYKPGLSFGLGLGFVMAGADDLNKPSAGSTYTGPTYGSSFALGGDLAVDYGLKGGFVIGGKFGFGPNRSHSITYTGGGKSQVDISNMALMLDPGYRFGLGHVGWLEVRVPLGYLMTTETASYTAPGYSASTKYTGSGYLLNPNVAFGKMLGQHFGLNLGVGYMISSVGALTDDKGNVSYYYPAGSTTKTNFTLNTGGIGVRLGLNFFL